MVDFLPKQHLWEVSTEEEETKARREKEWPQFCLLEVFLPLFI